MYYQYYPTAYTELSQQFYVVIITDKISVVIISNNQIYRSCYRYSQSLLIYLQATPHSIHCTSCVTTCQSAALHCTENVCHTARSPI